MEMAETQDTHPATSVRGKGWVTFDDNTDQANSSNNTPRRLSQSDETPGSLEVSICHHQCALHHSRTSKLELDVLFRESKCIYTIVITVEVCFSSCSPSVSGASCDNVKLCSVVVLQYFLFGVKLFYLSICNISTTAPSAHSKHTGDRGATTC